MKKKLKCLALCCAGIIGVAVASSTIGGQLQTVYAEEGESNEVATPIGVELSITEENELWVGDIVYFELDAKEDTEEGLYSYDIEIVEGNSVQVNKEISEYKGVISELGINCVEKGRSIIKVHFLDEEGKEGETVYNINVVEGQRVEAIEPEKTVKLGELVKFSFDNVRYGSSPNVSAVSDSNERLFYFDAGVAGYFGALDRRYNKIPSWLGYAYCWGEFDIEFNDGYTKEVCGKVIVEEPVIQTSIPQYVVPGDKVKIDAMISNVASGLFADVQPEITIIDGNDNVIAVGDSTTLTIGDTLEFLHTGTVKLSIKYSDIPDVRHDIPIIAEKIITVQIIEKNESIVENINKEDITSITKETLANAFKNNNSITINCIEDGTTLYSWIFGSKNKNTAVDVDLNVNMGIDDEQVKKLTSNKAFYVLKFLHNGNLPDNTNVKVIVPDEFNNAKAYLYHLEKDGTATLTYEGMVEDGYMSMPLSHCSTYFITKEKLEEAEKTIIEEVTTENSTVESADNDESKSPDTGDSSAIVMYIAILAVSVGILGLIGRKKVRN